MTDNHTELCERLRNGPTRVGYARRAADLIEQQVASIQQQALEYVSLQAQCDEHLARIAELEKERDALKSDAERWRIIESTLPTDELQDIAIIVAAEHSVNVANGFSRTPTDLLDTAITTLQAEKETR